VKAASSPALETPQSSRKGEKTLPPFAPCEECQHRLRPRLIPGSSARRAVKISHPDRSVRVAPNTRLLLRSSLPPGETLSIFFLCNFENDEFLPDHDTLLVPHIPTDRKYGPSTPRPRASSTVHAKPMKGRPITARGFHKNTTGKFGLGT